jgi:hypothetical protein
MRGPCGEHGPPVPESPSLVKRRISPAAGRRHEEQVRSLASRWREVGIEDLDEEVLADPLVLVGELQKLCGRAPSHGDRWQRQTLCVVAGEQGVVAESG